MRVIYLAGPMKGYPDKNFKLFQKVASALREEGHRVYSPHEFPDNAKNTFDIRKAFAMYSTFICLEADSIVMLPNHEKSLGATTELGLAKNCGLDLFEWDDELEIYTTLKG